MVKVGAGHHGRHLFHRHSRRPPPAEGKYSVRVVIDTRGVARDIFAPGEYRVAWLPDTNYQAVASRV